MSVVIRADGHCDTTKRVDYNLSMFEFDCVSKQLDRTASRLHSVYYLIWQYINTLFSGLLFLLPFLGQCTDLEGIQ